VKVLKAVFLTEFKKPLEVRDIEAEKALAMHEVLIQIEMSGVCYRDLLTVDGFFPKARLPLILGHEIAGRIAAVGEGVEDFKVGDRVASLTYIYCGECSYCKSGRENLCKRRLWFGEHMNGSYAEFVKTHARSLVKIPDGVSPEGAAIAACVTGMLIHAFKKVASLQQGESVLVTGAGGGVGIHAVQVAKALGCKVIAATSSPSKVERIAGVGADSVLVIDDKFGDEIRRLTDGEGVDVVLEAVGQPTFSLGLRSLRWGGRIVVVGNVTAASVEFPLGFIILRENYIAGCISSTKADVKEALMLTAEGKINPVVSVYPLEKAQEAHAAIRRKETVGRVLLKP